MDDQDHALRLMGVGSKADETVIFHGVELPTWFTAVMYRPDVPYSVTFFVRIDPKRGPQPSGIQVNADTDSGLTYKDALALVKGAPVDKLIQEAFRLLPRVATWQQGLDALGKAAGAGLTQPEYDHLKASVEAAMRTAPELSIPVRRRIITEDLLNEVAGVYRQAIAEHQPPTQAVATHFTSTHSTAARWVREARKAGVLGPSRGPVAGEDRPPTASE